VLSITSYDAMIAPNAEGGIDVTIRGYSPTLVIQELPLSHCILRAVGGS
jgi:hypothetical protein